MSWPTTWTAPAEPGEALHPTRRLADRIFADPDSAWFAGEVLFEIADEHHDRHVREPDGTFMSYQQYLQTPEWREYRKAVFGRHGGRCTMCAGRAEHCHHRTYAHVGFEADADCVPVCADCHARHHGARPRRRRR